MKTRLLSLLLAYPALLASSFADIKSKAVLYSDGATTLEGFVAYDDTIIERRPGILLIHDWTGLQEYTQTRAKQIAADLGYVAFAADIYGKGVRPNDPKDCAVQAGTYKKDLPLLRRRVLLGLDELKKQQGVDASRLAAIGYCFGGTSVLELARSGANVAGVVSFHGGLSTTIPAKAGAVKAQVLVLHGADDPFVKPDEVAAFKEEMKAAGVQMNFVAYPGAVHSFTKPAAGNDPSKGAAYHEKADKESWAAMKKFFAKIFQ